MVVVRDLTRLDALDGHRSVHDCNDFRLSVFHKYHLLSFASVSAEIECLATAGPRFLRDATYPGSEGTNPYGRMCLSQFSKTTACAKSGSGIMSPALAFSKQAVSRVRSMTCRVTKMEFSANSR